MNFGREKGIFVNTRSFGGQNKNTIFFCFGVHFVIFENQEEIILIPKAYGPMGDYFEFSKTPFTTPPWPIKGDPMLPF